MVVVLRQGKTGIKLKGFNPSRYADNSTVGPWTGMAFMVINGIRENG